MVDEKTLGAEQLPGLVRIIDPNFQAGRAVATGANIDEAVERGFKGLRESRIVMEDVLALLTPNQSVLVNAADGRVQPGDGLVAGEGPAGYPELLVVGVYPKLGQIQVAD